VVWESYQMNLGVVCLITEIDIQFQGKVGAGNDGIGHGDMAGRQENPR